MFLSFSVYACFRLFEEHIPERMLSLIEWIFIQKCNFFFFLVNIGVNKEITDGTGYVIEVILDVRILLHQ